MSFLALILRDPRHIAIAALGITCCVLWARSAWLENSRDAAAAKLDAMAAKVLVADQSVKQAQAVNQHNARRMQEQTQAIAALRTEAERQEQRATEAQARVMADAAKAREADKARRARPDMPTPAEMTAVLRESLEGM